MSTGTASVEENRNHWLRQIIPMYSGQMVSLLGSSLVQFALVWWLTRETGSAVVLATSTFVALIPNLLLGPFAGALVDRWNRKLVLIVSDAIIALSVGVLGILFAFNLQQVWHIYVIIFIRALGSTFHWPAMSASVSRLVPEKHLSRFAGISQAARGSIEIAAPPLGALCMELLPIYGVIFIDVATAIIAITVLAFITIPAVERSDKGMITPALLLKDVSSGIKFLMSWRGAFSLMIIASMVNFFLIPMDTLMPLMVTQELKRGVWELGGLQSAAGVGIIAGGLILGSTGGFKPRILNVIFGLLGLGTATIIISITPANTIMLAFIGFSMLGICLPLANGSLAAIMQASVPHEMQGRVFSVISTMAMAVSPIAALMTAPLSMWLGIRNTYLASGILVIMMGIVSLLSPAILGIEKSAKLLKQEATNPL